MAAKDVTEWTCEGSLKSVKTESMADGIPAVIMGACVFAHDRVDVFCTSIWVVPQK